MNNFKSSMITDAALSQTKQTSTLSPASANTATSSSQATPTSEYHHHQPTTATTNLGASGETVLSTAATTAATQQRQHHSTSAAQHHRSVQDLIVRYKEVSSWIKRLIQSQPSTDKRTSIILSAIRCAITCWNLGNFNSSREIWLGLK